MIITPAFLGSLADAETAVRLSLHVTAAAIWVGGMLALAGLLPDRAFTRRRCAKSGRTGFRPHSVAAYFVLVATGIWNIAASHPSAQSRTWDTVLSVKIAVALLAGVFACLHQPSRSKAGLAAFGGLSGVTSLAALVLGVLLAG